MDSSNTIVWVPWRGMTVPATYHGLVKRGYNKGKVYVIIRGKKRIVDAKDVKYFNRKKQ